MERRRIKKLLIQNHSKYKTLTKQKYNKDQNKLNYYKCYENKHCK